MRQNCTAPGLWCREVGELRCTLVARHCTGSLERNVLTCDYNGWADVPEDEREALELLDAGPWISRDIIPLAATPLLPVEVPLTPSDRRAA
jgi:hypothetical protein